MKKKVVCAIFMCSMMFLGCSLNEGRMQEGSVQNEQIETTSDAETTVESDAETEVEEVEEEETQVQTESTAETQTEEEVQAEAEAQAQAEAQAEAEAQTQNDNGATVVSRRYIEDCGLDSGYWEITYSDGRVEYIDE